MELEKQVCPLELAKKLKELGVPQTAYWSWVFRKGRYEQEHATYLLETGSAYNFRPDRLWSAFTVAELGEMLPSDVGVVSLKMGKSVDGYWVSYCLTLTDGSLAGEVVKAETEADARAKCLIYLLENGLLKAEDLK